MVTKLTIEIRKSGLVPDLFGEPRENVRRARRFIQPSPRLGDLSRARPERK
jgi:hypothetical protein